MGLVWRARTHILCYGFVIKTKTKTKREREEKLNKNDRLYWKHVGRMWNEMDCETKSAIVMRVEEEWDIRNVQVSVGNKVLWTKIKNLKDGNGQK